MENGADMEEVLKAYCRDAAQLETLSTRRGQREPSRPDINQLTWLLSPPSPYTCAGFANQVFSCGSASKESACNAGDLGCEDPLEKGRATHSSILAWRIPWTV